MNPLFLFSMIFVTSCHAATSLRAVIDANDYYYLDYHNLEQCPSEFTGVSAPETSILCCDINNIPTNATLHENSSNHTSYLNLPNIPICQTFSVNVTVLSECCYMLLQNELYNIFNITVPTSPSSNDTTTTNSITSPMTVSSTTTTTLASSSSSTAAQSSSSTTTTLTNATTVPLITEQSTTIAETSLPSTATEVTTFTTVSLTSSLSPEAEALNGGKTNGDGETTTIVDSTSESQSDYITPLLVCIVLALSAALFCNRRKIKNLIFNKNQGNNYNNLDGSVNRFQMMPVRLNAEALDEDLDDSFFH